ncbi:MAG: efflux RND transporter periplasmic adaptor subunit [Candidatus Hydrogenedentes bacterium]|nr:efflux RND transporter periplasmic adaptor subunit [Candidatus Hydrogenedentota bacterium]
MSSSAAAAKAFSGTTFIAKRGDLDITVTEGGDVQAIESQEIRSPILKGTVKILSIVEEGLLVTPQDVEDGLILVELDSADLVERSNDQEISVQTAEAQFMESRAQRDIQASANQSQISAAELTAKFALMDFEKFLGKGAVNSIVGKLKLDERAAELKKIADAGGVNEKPPLPTVAAATSITKGLGEGPAWGNFPPTEGSGPPPGMSRGEGGAPPRGRSQFGGQRGGPGGARGGFGAEGGGMAGGAERFKKMIEANDGKIPEAMAERIRGMGMDPDEIMQRMGNASPAETDPSKIVQELKYSSSDLDIKKAFTNEPEYVAARAAIDFSAYADVELLEDGEAKETLHQQQGNVLVSTEAYRLAQRRLLGKERLFEKDFITQNELDDERLTVQSRELDQELSKMTQQLYIEYTFQKQAESLLSDYEEALMDLERRMYEASAQMAQRDVACRSRKKKLQLETRELEEYREQIEMCTIRALVPGLVVYGSSSGRNPWRGSNDEPIKEGTSIHRHQKIITIPDMTQMGVTVDIHESSVQKVAKGQRVTMSIDAFRDRPLTGLVERVAVLADSANMFMNPDLKVYPTVVRIDGVHDWLRPGMSAEVVILIETLEDIVYIPIQAVTYFGDNQVCYVVNNGRSERRFITTGGFTEDFIEVRSGLEEGEEVRLLAPGAGEQDDLIESEGVEEGGRGAEPPEPKEARDT